MQTVISFMDTPRRHSQARQPGDFPEFHVGSQHPESVRSWKVVVLKSVRLKLAVGAAKDPAVGMGGPNGGYAVGPSGCRKCGVAPAVGFRGLQPPAGVSGVRLSHRFHSLFALFHPIR
jgi:hypothetical protein